MERGAWTESLLDEVLEQAETVEGSRDFFRIVVERLADLFEPRLCDVYARLFSQIAERMLPGVRGAALVSRYERTRRVRQCTLEPDEVFVLSRVTLGADVAVTSVVLDAVKRRFPSASIWFVGSRKNWELFSEDARIRHWPIDYRRGTLRERLAVAAELRSEFHRPGCIVVDPDSRLTQLGLLPVCEEDGYFFFESRAAGGATAASLGELVQDWVEQTFGIHGANAYIAPPAEESQADLAISFGVGDNEDKRIDDPYERHLLRALTAKGYKLVVDTGAGGSERERVERAAEGLQGIQLWRGGYAPFASMLSQCGLYIGYDSAGQHVAAAVGVPLISVFAGYPSERMFQRWRPTGRGEIRVIQAKRRDPDLVLKETLRVLGEIPVG